MHTIHGKKIPNKSVINRGLNELINGLTFTVHSNRIFFNEAAVLYEKKFRESNGEPHKEKNKM